MKDKKKVTKAEKVQAVGKGVALTDEQMAYVVGGKESTVNDDGLTPSFTVTVNTEPVK